MGSNPCVSHQAAPHQWRGVTPGWTGQQQSEGREAGPRVASWSGAPRLQCDELSLS